MNTHVNAKKVSKTWKALKAVMLKYVGSNSTTLAAHRIKRYNKFPRDDQLNEVEMHDVSHYQTGLNYNFLLCYKTISESAANDGKLTSIMMNQSILYCPEIQHIQLATVPISIEDG